MIHLINFCYLFFFSYSETVFETRSGPEVFSIRLNMETLAPGLCLDANVIDCWGAILNHEESVKDVGSLSRHFFPTDCIVSFFFVNFY